MKKIPIRQISEAHKELPASERFTIRRVEDIMGGNDLAPELHRHDFFFILSLEYGKGHHEIDFTPYKVNDNSVFFLRPGQVHQLELKAGCTGYLMEFSTGFYHPKDKLSRLRLRKASHKTWCKPDSGRFEKLLAILKEMFGEYINREEGYQDVIKANLDIFIIEFIRQSTSSKVVPKIGNPYIQERLEEFLELLDNHITTHKQVSQYTDLMNLSAYQLNEITKATLGKTSSTLINEHIILEAKRHLLATTNQIKDIADQLGYEDPSYFIRFFRKHTGYSPDAFRHHFG